MTAATLTPTDWTAQFGARLRATRKTRGLSLNGVETKSGGRFPAVVIGSYERGDRNPTVERIHEYAEFLGVRTVDLIPDVNPLREAMYRSTR